LPNWSAVKTSRRQKKLLYHVIILLAIGLLFTLFTFLAQPFFSINMWLTDRLFVSQNISPNVVIVGIDDATLTKYGKWSDWPRSLHAQAIDNLAQARAKVIGFDILFVDSSSQDHVLSQSVENAGNVVLAEAGSEPLYRTSGAISSNSVMQPVPLLEDVCRAMGHVTILPDSDGKARKIPLIIRDTQGKEYPSLSLSMLSVLFSMPLPETLPANSGRVILFSRDIPVDSQYQLRVHFSEEPEKRSYLSYGDVISGNFDPFVVKNKIVVIGMTATGEFDNWDIPTSSASAPGVYIHAAALDTILTGAFLKDAAIWLNIVILLVLTFALAFVLPRLKVKWGLVMVTGLLIVYLLACFIAFDHGYIINMISPLLLIGLIFIGNTTTAISLEQSDKRFIKDLFGRYVSPQVANNILNLADNGALRLGGEQRQVTILFADIRNYTKLSEQLSPTEVVNMLNIYLGAMIEKVLANDGMVNKFAGDNIMAVWNAPQTQPRHSLLAVKAAWEAQRTIIAMQKDNEALPKVQFGIGINTGVALAGNVGSSGRSEYTVIGDAVNLASRICSATPGGEVWLGPETFASIREQITADQLEPQAFKGKTEKVTVFRLTGFK
jgi:adenylate cyclase